MNTRDVKQLAAINHRDGEKVGNVERAYFDPVKKHVVGFAIATEGGFLRPERAVIADTIEIHSLGSGGLMLDSATPQGVDTSRRFSSLIDLESIDGRDVFTEDGIHVGQVSAAEFDEHRYTLSTIAVAPGFFKSDRTIPVGQVTTIGPDVIVVSPAVAIPEPEPEPTSEATSDDVRGETVAS